MTDKAVALVERTPQGDRAMSPFADEQSFEPAQRMAKALATSTLVPKDYQNNIPNVLIAMELANRTGASVLMVMQNLYLVHGRPGWASSFLIATVNSTGRFTPLRFRFQGDEGKDTWGCRAVAVDKKSGEECIGSLITIGMAKKEGWYQKSGSKWQTMPEQMLMYRSASFWTRAFAPEVALGIHTAEEVVEMYGGDNRQSAAVADLNAALADEVVEAEIVEETDGDLFGAATEEES